MSGPKNRVIDLIPEVHINLVTPEGSPEPAIKKEPTPPPPEPKVVTSGPATSNQEKMKAGVRVVQSASAGAAGGSAKISEPGAAAEARRANDGDCYHRASISNVVEEMVQETRALSRSYMRSVMADRRAAAKEARENARAAWDAGNGIPDGPATTVVKSEPGAGGSANTVVKSEPGVGGSAVDQGETTDEWSDEEERPRAGGKMRVDKPPGPRRKPYER